MLSMKIMFSSTSIWEEECVLFIVFIIHCLKVITISTMDLFLWIRMWYKHLTRIVIHPLNLFEDTPSIWYQIPLYTSFDWVIDRIVKSHWNMLWLFRSPKNKASIIILSSSQWFQTTTLDCLSIQLYHLYQSIMNSQRSSGSMRKIQGYEKENGQMKCSRHVFFLFQRRFVLLLFSMRTSLTHHQSLLLILWDILINYSLDHCTFERWYVASIQFEKCH